MIVVADASPLNYLIQIGSVWILPKIYDQIVVPHGVIEELEREDAPVEVRNWVTRLPSWIVRGDWRLQGAGFEPQELWVYW